MPPAIPDKIPCESVDRLTSELEAIQETLNLKETEESWEKISRALQKLTALVKGGAYRYPHELVAGMKVMAAPIKSAMSSERTRLSGIAVDLLVALAPRLDANFEPLVPIFLPTVMQLCSRANRLYITRSRSLLEAITSHTVLTNIIPYLARTCEDKSSTAREVAMDYIFHSLNRFNPPHLMKYAESIEQSIRLTGTDKDAAVRSTSRKVFEAYKILWPNRVDDFVAPLTPVIKKYLDIRSRTLSRPAPVPLNIIPVKPKTETQERGRPRHRRSLSVDAAEPRMGRTENVVLLPELVTKVVPVRRARSQKPAAERAIKPEVEVAAPAKRPQENPIPLSTSTHLPFRPNPKPVAGNHLADTPHHGARRIQAELPVTDNAPSRSGPSRPVPTVKPQGSKDNVAAVAAKSSEVATVIPVLEPKEVKAEVHAQLSGSSNGGERRGQGAQRILLPPKPAPQDVGVAKPVRPVKAEKPKEEARAPSRAATHSRTNSQTVSRPPSRAASTLSSGSGVAKHDAKASVKVNTKTAIPAKAIPRHVKPNIVKANINPKAGTSATTTNTDGPRTEAPKPASQSTRRGLTAPTLAQLSRAKALETERAKIPVQPKQPGARGLPRRGFVPVRGRGRAVGGPSGTRVVKPEPIPEAEVPLPKSPELKAQEGESVELIELVQTEPLAPVTPPSRDVVDSEPKASGEQPVDNDEPLLVDLSTPKSTMQALVPISPSPRSGSPSRTRRGKKPARDPFSGLTEYLMEALDAPLPATPVPTAFPQYETEVDTTMPYSPSTDGGCEDEDDDEMERLEFAVDGIDQFGKIIRSPRKPVQNRVREALATIVLNRQQQRQQQEQVQEVL